MENLLLLLATFFFVATIVQIAIDNLVDVFKVLGDLQAYKLIFALILTGFCVLGMNIGLLDTLGLPLEQSQPWFHYLDLVLTTLFLTKGAQAIHRLNDAWTEYRSSATAPEVPEDDI